MSIFDVPIAELHEPNELAHFGVKGMKWGRRKKPSRAERRRRKAVQKAEPQPWNPKFVGSRINRKYLGKF